MTRDYMRKLAADAAIMTDAAKIEELQRALRQLLDETEPRQTASTRVMEKWARWMNACDLTKDPKDWPSPPKENLCK